MPVSVIAQQPVREIPANQITTENRNIFRAIADKFVSVVNSCKTFSTGCSTQKDHNILKACERLAALTLVKPEYYITDAMKDSAGKLGMTLPDNTASVSNKADISAAASIGKLFTLKTSECSAQELHDVLSKQLYKPGTSEGMRTTIQETLNMVNAGISCNDFAEEKFAGTAERGVDRVKDTMITEIVKQSRINEMSGKEGLTDEDITILEAARNNPFDIYLHTKDKTEN